MKNTKLLLTLSITLLIALTAGGIYFISTRNQEEPIQEVKHKEVNFLPNLNQSSFEAKRNSGEEFYLFVWRPDCGDSQIFIDEFLYFFAEYNEDGSFARLKYDLGNTNFYSLDVSEFIEKISDTTTRKQYRDLYGFYFTPSLVYYKDIDEDGISDVVDISEWDPVYGFYPSDYMGWFYEHDLVIPNQEVTHKGISDKKD